MLWCEHIVVKHPLVWGLWLVALALITLAVVALRRENGKANGKANSWQGFAQANGKAAS